MTREEWERFCASVKDAMAAYVRPFSTPISMTEAYGSGVAWATGAYAECVRGLCLLTAAHVFTDVPEGGRLAHLPTPGKDYVAISTSPEIAPWPVDAAAFDVPPIPEGSVMRSVPPNLTEKSFSAVEGEVLFWIGFPGYTLERHDAISEGRRRKTWFGELNTTGVPMLSQVAQQWNGEHELFDNGRHVALHYPSAAKRTVEAAPEALPHPKGMSGSLLWDTKAVRAVRRCEDWTPDLARVCGLIWAALDDPEVIFATKIEHVRAGLPMLMG